MLWTLTFFKQLARKEDILYLQIYWRKDIFKQESFIIYIFFLPSEFWFKVDNISSLSITYWAIDMERNYSFYFKTYLDILCPPISSCFNLHHLGAGKYKNWGFVLFSFSFSLFWLQCRRKIFIKTLNGCK